MAVKVGSFTKSTNTSVPVSQAITGVGFKPRALILFTSAQTAVDEWTAGKYLALGYAARNAADTITVGSIAGASEDNVGTSNSTRRLAAKALTICEWSEALLAECDLSSFDTDGFTLSWTTNNATAYVIHYMALGGPDLTDAKVVQWNWGTATGDHAVTGVGFEPDCVLHMCAKSANALPQLEVSSSISVGGMDDSGSQYALHDWSRDAQGTTVSYTGCFANRTLWGVGTASIQNFSAAYVSMDADGFTISITAGTTAYKAFSLCLKGGSYKVTAENTSAAAAPPDNQSFSIGFRPEGVLAFTNTSSINTSTNHATTEGDIAFCATDGTNSRSVDGSDDFNQDTSSTGRYQSQTQFLLSDKDADQADIQLATLASLDASGFTVTKSLWPSPGSMGYFAFAGGAVAGGSALLMQHYHHSEFHGGAHK